jgi:hypothetical protein
MVDNVTAVSFVDGAGITRQQNSTNDNSGFIAPQTALRTNGAPVEANNPLPIADAALLAAFIAGIVVKPAAITITQTVVALTSADVVIVAANSNRKYLAIINIGTGLASLGFGSVAVAGQGWPLSAASAAGDAGGGLERSGDGITLQAIHGICAAGVTTNVVVLEGV